MKKFFTLMMLALLMSVGASAQRKTWDFTKGFSATTLENLQKAGWIKDGDQGQGTIQCGSRTAGPVAATIDGVEWVCPETEGLSFAATSAKHLIFAYDQTNTGFKGKKYLWINGKNAQDAITIPSVPAGEKVTITYESHKTTEARGFKTSGSFSDADGNTTFTSMGDTVTVVIYNKGSETADLTLQSTSGHHIYKIIIGEGDPAVSEGIAYLYTGATDATYQQLQARENATVTAIDVASTTLTAEALRGYSLVVIAPSVPADNAVTAVVKEALPYVPTLNLNGTLYPAWTYGAAVAITEPLGIVTDKNSSLLAGVEFMQEEDLTFIEIGAGTSGVQLSDYFEGDPTPLMGMDGTTVVAHTHNINHNGYVFFAGAAENPAGAQKVISNAVDLLINSKAEVTAAPSPGIALEYKDKNTNIKLTASSALTKPHIYYTLDGSTPTESSTEYTDVINVTELCTVKAVCIAEGYLLSNVNSKEVDIKEQPKTPVISAVEEDGVTTVTITCESANEETPIYFNLSGSTEASQSMVYTEPFTITMPQDIYAYAVANEAVWSEVAHSRVLVKNPHVAVDIIGHFATGSNWVKTAEDGTQTTLGNNGSLFSANTKDATSMYKEGGEVTKTTDEEGNEIEIKEEIDYMTFDEPGENPQWTVMSKGQVVLWQNNDASFTNIIGNNDAGVYPATPLDIDTLFVGTKNNICFYTCFAGEQPNAVIQSKVKFKGPFDIVTIANMATGALMLEVSTDGKSWTQVGDTIQRTGYSRLWKKYAFSYAGTDEVFVRAAQPTNGASGPKIYDIYIANAGEQSAALLAALTDEYNNGTGIVGIAEKNTKVASGIYNLNGIRQSGLKRGLNIVVSGDGSVKKVMVK